MLAAGVCDLGLSVSEFWAMTPRMFGVLWRRHVNTFETRERAADARIAPLTIAVANYLRDAQRRPQPFTPGDFFPSLRPLESDQPIPGFPTVEQLEAGRRATEERLARIEAGLPIEDVPTDEKIEQMIQTVRDYTKVLVEMPRRRA